jgi:hypothetical protein
VIEQREIIADKAHHTVDVLAIEITAVERSTRWRSDQQDIH